MNARTLRALAKAVRSVPKQAAKAANVVGDVSMNVGKGVKVAYQRGGPVARGAVIGAGVGSAYETSNIGRKYKAHGAQRVRRAVRGAYGGALAGASVGAVYRFGKTELENNAIRKGTWRG